jgi:hypothetical protein
LECEKTPEVRGIVTRHIWGALAVMRY